MENKFLFDVTCQRLSPSAKLIYLIIKVAQKKLHIKNVSELSGIPIAPIRSLMKEINENFDIYTLLDANEFIISE